MAGDSLPLAHDGRGYGISVSTWPVEGRGRLCRTGQVELELEVRSKVDIWLAVKGRLRRALIGGLGSTLRGTLRCESDNGCWTR